MKALFVCSVALAMIVMPMEMPDVRAAATTTSKAETVASLIGQVRSLISEHYVRPETRASLDAALVKGLKNGRYSLRDPSVLADRVTEDLEEVSHDKHLYLHFSPAEAKRYQAGQTDKAEGDREFAAFSHERNHGISEMRVLEGNVRYVRIDAFLWAGDETRNAYDVAMRFLAQGDAAVIDLRSNGGGDGNASRYLVSHFVPAGTPLMTFYLDGKVIERSKADAVPQETSMVGKPLYVLAGPRSASAAEEFVGLVKSLRLGELIGETSAGAGYNNQLYPVGEDFVLSVSIGRAEVTSTREGWEGKGWTPTIAAPVSSALRVAQAQALRTLASKTTAPEKRADLLKLASVAEQAASPAAAAHPLQSYAGAFGARTVSLSGKGLLLERPGSLPVQLVPVGGDRFAFDADLGSTVEFQVEGQGASAMTLVRADGSRFTQMRTQ